MPGFLHKDGTVNWLAKLMAEHSWTIQRISSTTFAQDVTLRNPVPEVQGRELESLPLLIRQGLLYRARIAKGKYYYGKTAEEAAQAACYWYEVEVAKTPSPLVASPDASNQSTDRTSQSSGQP